MGFRGGGTENSKKASSPRTPETTGMWGQKDRSREKLEKKGKRSIEGKNAAFPFAQRSSALQRKKCNEEGDTHRSCKRGGRSLVGNK